MALPSLFVHSLIWCICCHVEAAVLEQTEAKVKNKDLTPATFTIESIFNNKWAIIR
jgi:hypothetical protein